MAESFHSNKRLKFGYNAQNRLDKFVQYHSYDDFLKNIVDKIIEFDYNK